MKLYFYVKLKKILDKKGISQKDLAAMTGLREATISELANDSRSAYNKKHILKIMEALKITDLSDLIEVRSIYEDDQNTFRNDLENDLENINNINRYKD